MTTMPGYRPYAPAPARRRGLGITALVLGVSAVPLAFLCGIGLLPALAGLAIGVVAALRGQGRGQAIAGIVASLLALAIAGGVAYLMLSKAAKCARFPDSTARKACVEREFPMIDRSADQ
jgi:hypothetical protein